MWGSSIALMEAQYCHVAWWGNGVLLMVFGLQDPRIKKAKWSVLTRTEECDGYWRDGPFMECARTFAFQWKRWWTIKIDRHLNMIELDLKKIRDIQYFHFWQKIVLQIQPALPWWCCQRQDLPWQISKCEIAQQANLVGFVGQQLFALYTKIIFAQ